MNLFKKTLLFVIVASAAGTGVSQSPPRTSFNRPQVYDVKHYVIRVGFDRPAKKVIGETTIRFAPLSAGISSVEFDAVDIKFESVTNESNGATLPFKVMPGRIIVNLQRDLSLGEEVGLKFRHSSVPKKGVYFVPPSDAGAMLAHSEQIWTQGEPDEARHWFPSFDFPSDKATTEQFITAKPDEAVIGNGELVSATANADGTVTHHYRMRQPLPTYLVSFVIGKYVKVSENYRDIPLGYYVYPGVESIVPKAYGTTKEMMRIFEDLTQMPYPFNKYDQTMVSAFNFGGMENITATTMADTEIMAASSDLMVAGVHDLVSHELAHSWFGNTVTCKNWAELWLNEGFATYLEAVIREKMFGRQNYMTKVLRDAYNFLADDAVHSDKFGLYNQKADAVDKLFDRPAVTYSKGGAVLHQLREEVGDAAFWKGVRLYLTRHRFGVVETTDLIEAMEEASGRDLNWFFDQWVYKAGHPKLTIRRQWIPKARTLQLTVTQTQTPTRMVPAAFRLPLELELMVGREKRLEKINVTRRVETFSFKLPSAPAEIAVDPREKLPIKRVKIVP